MNVAELRDIGSHIAAASTFLKLPLVHVRTTNNVSTYNGTGGWQYHVTITPDIRDDHGTVYVEVQAQKGTWSHVTSAQYPAGRIKLLARDIVSLCKVTRIKAQGTDDRTELAPEAFESIERAIDKLVEEDDHYNEKTYYVIDFCQFLDEYEVQAPGIVEAFYLARHGGMNEFSSWIKLLLRRKSSLLYARESYENYRQIDGFVEESDSISYTHPSQFGEAFKAISSSKEWVEQKFKEYKASIA